MWRRPNVGEVTIFDEVNFIVEPPDCNGITGYAGFLGCPSTFVVGQSGDCVSGTPGVLSYDLVIFEGTSCEERYTGEITTECDLCCPTITSPNLPLQICDEDSFYFCIDFDGSTKSISSAELLVNGNFTPITYELVNNQLCISSSLELNNCMPEIVSLQISTVCQDIMTTNLLGDMVIYPSDLNYFPDFQPSDNCGEIPNIIPPTCGVLNILELVPPDNNPANPTNGYIEWVVIPEFDISDAPPCFNENFLSNTYTIFACGNCASGHGILDPKTIRGKE